MDQSDPLALFQAVSDGRIGDYNEAQTRAKIIDPILYDFLGWLPDEVTVEERASEDGDHSFIDYFLRTAQVKILVEAKRLSVSFGVLPAPRRVQLKGSWMRGAVGSAVKQARDYARQKGAGFCAVTNGDAWIVFPVNRRDGIAFEDSTAIIFRNAEAALNKDVVEFTSLLSRSSIIDGSLDRALLGGDSNQADTRRLNQIYDQSFSYIARSPIFRYIEAEIVTSFNDELLSDNPEILKKVYVTTAERTRFDDRIGMTIRKRDQVLRTSPIKPMSGSGLTRVKDRIRDITVQSRPAVLLTLGLVGSGKTTFLHHMRTVSCAEYFSEGAKNPAQWIYIDFRDFSPFEVPRHYIFERCLDYINKSDLMNDYPKFISKAYAAEVDRLKRGPLSLMAGNSEAVNGAIYRHIESDISDKEPYVTKMLTYASEKFPLYLVIDNVDQIEAPGVQESIFLEALSLSRRVRSNLILAMRDYTYVKSRSSPLFDAFDFDAIYIDAPPIDAVLSARFKLAELLSAGKVVEGETSRGQPVKARADELISLLRKSVLSTNVGRIIDVAAFGDVRLALQMTRQFLQYGYSSSLEAYLKQKAGAKLYLAEHEAVRAIMFGNQLIYKDEYSPFLNPFDAKIGRSEAQFLRLYILSVLVNAATESGFKGVDALEVIRNLEKIGFGERIVTKVIEDLIAGRLIVTNSHQPFNREAILSPTRFGGYMVRELLPMFVFLETTIYDTFIYDDDTWYELKGLFRKIYAERVPYERLKLRKAAVGLFFEFCCRGMSVLIANAQMHGLPPAWLVNPLERSRSAFSAGKARAMRSARNAKRRNQH